MAFDITKLDPPYVYDNCFADFSFITPDKTYQSEGSNYYGGSASSVFGLFLFSNADEIKNYATKIRGMVKEDIITLTPENSNIEFMLTPLLFMLPNELKSQPCLAIRCKNVTANSTILYCRNLTLYAVSTIKSSDKSGAKYNTDVFKTYLQDPDKASPKLLDKCQTVFYVSDSDTTGTTDYEKCTCKLVFKEVIIKHNDANAVSSPMTYSLKSFTKAELLINDKPVKTFLGSETGRNIAIDDVTSAMTIFTTENKSQASAGDKVVIRTPSFIDTEKYSINGVENQLANSDDAFVMYYEKNKNPKTHALTRTNACRSQISKTVMTFGCFTSAIDAGNDLVIHANILKTQSEMKDWLNTCRYKLPTDENYWSWNTYNKTYNGVTFNGKGNVFYIQTKDNSISGYSEYDNFVDAINVEDLSLDKDFNKKIHQVLWLNPPTDEAILNGEKDVTTVSITYEYGDNLYTVDCKTISDIRFNKANMCYYVTSHVNDNLRYIIENDIQIAGTNYHIDKFFIRANLLHTQMPIYYSIKELVNYKNPGSLPLNKNSLATNNYIYFSARYLSGYATLDAIWTAFDNNVVLTTVNVGGSNVQRPIKLLTDVNTSYHCNDVQYYIAMYGSSNGGGTIAAKANYHVGYLIDDKVSIDSFNNSSYVRYKWLCIYF